MAEFGQHQRRLFDDFAHRYSPVTVLPEPGGATMCSLRSPAQSCFRNLTTSCCDGRNSPLKRILGKSPAMNASNINDY